MRLSGACSNRNQLAVVREAAEARSKLTTEPSTESSRKPLRKRRGEIQDAVLSVLKSNDGAALRPSEVRDLVAARHLAEISYDTIASFLSVTCRSDRWPIERVGAGLYSWRRM